MCAVEFIHSKRVVHGDIKIENVLLTNDHTIKLADFGMAAFEGLPGSYFGTMQYMAPEVLATRVCRWKRHQLESVILFLNLRCLRHYYAPYMNYQIIMKR